MFWEKIFNALLHELEKDPERVIDLLEVIVKLMQDNPDAVKALVNLAQERMKQVN